MTAVPEGLEEALARFASKHGHSSISLGESGAPRALVLSVDGSLDGGNSQGFLDIATLSLPEARRLGGLVVDLSALQYISSTGVGTLTTLLSETMRLGVPLFLRGMQEQVKAVLDLLGFSSFFKILPPEEARP